MRITQRNAGVSPHRNFPFQTSSDCNEELADFHRFLIARYSLDESDLKQRLLTSETSRKILERSERNLRRVISNLREEMNRLIEKDQTDVFITRNRLERLEDLVSVLVDKKIPKCDDQVVPGNKCQTSAPNTIMHLVLNPTDPQSKGDSPVDPTVFINFGNQGQKKLRHIGRDHTFMELFEMALELWEIPPQNFDKYVLFDLRCRVRNENFVMGNNLRDVHTFNLVERSRFHNYTAYELLVSDVRPSYNTKDYWPSRIAALKCEPNTKYSAILPTIQSPLPKKRISLNGKRKQAEKWQNRRTNRDYRGRIQQTVEPTHSDNNTETEVRTVEPNETANQNPINLVITLREDTDSGPIRSVNTKVDSHGNTYKTKY